VTLTTDATSAGRREAWLGRAARRLAATPEIWQPRIRRDTDERWYALLAADEDSEAWLLGWPVGGSIELHDHGDSSGAICVVAGVLDEAFVDAADPATAAGSLRRRRLPTGSLVSFGPGHVHDVVNHRSAPALSIHVYSPRLRSMTFYVHGTDSGIVPVRTEYGEGH
jgi:predicted metal-dependent enzyme (double-stranded beta helix superfamily)